MAGSVLKEMSVPVELGVWRIDNGVRDVAFGSLDYEQRLEDILAARIDIASPNWMIIGRQVHTKFGKIIDLLAIDEDGKLVVLELKRDKSYRDVVAQTLDYGTWVKDLSSDSISKVFQNYQTTYFKSEQNQSLDEAFKLRFGIDLPDELNESHELVIVASSLDPATERIVQYLREQYRVPINAVFFNVFREEDREFLSRVWLSDPTNISEEPALAAKQDWNGEYYVSYNGGTGPGKRSWRDAVKYGFISGGGAPFYSRTLHLLEPGGRIWVNVPRTGYVGVGRVLDKAKRVNEFRVPDPDRGGKKVPLLDLNGKLQNKFMPEPDPDKAEYFVPIEWIKTVSLDDAVKEKGFFGNQNTVAKPRVQKWEFTVDRLKSRFGLRD